MSNFPGSPKLVKGGIVLIDPSSASIQRIIPLQYNPDTMTRSLTVQGAGEEGGDRSEMLRLTGAPVETYSIEIQLDATDALSLDASPEVEMGILHRLAAFESLLYPSIGSLIANNNLAQIGTLEIAPMVSPLSLFVWNKNRIIPMRITEFTITEEAYDENLNPIRAKISLSMRVLSTTDLGFGKMGGIYLKYQQAKEQLANKFTSGAFSDLGISSI
ncbi:MAG: hypothetical protein KA536_15920 [Saprospiraceae bacterium]|nr:hypothetical protein [Saprospiraceae bacterium]